MKLLVCGGRNFRNYSIVEISLDTHKPTFIVEGGATGADSLARRYAKEHNILCDTVKADWGKFGKSAGPRRNEAMLRKHPDLDAVIAFPGGSGTKNMVELARQAGIKVYEYADVT